MKKLKKIFFLSLLMASHSTALFAADCVFVIMGGSKNWMSVLPGAPTDISIDVDAAVKTEARKTGCQIISMANDDEATFLNNLKALSRNKAGTNVHLAFTDHGAPPGKNIADSALITGMGKHTTYGKFMQALKENIPKGSRVTFQTNNCWGNIAEAVIATKLDSHFDICGGASTSAQQMSWNLHEIYERDNGVEVGPYGAVGLRYATRYKKQKGRAPGIAEFHHYAKKGDAGNLSRQPGLTSSLSFANNTLVQKKQKSPLLTIDIFEALSEINWKNDKALDNFLNLSKRDLLLSTESRLNGSCTTYAKTPFDDFIKRISPLYYNLVNSNFAILPAPYGAQALAAKSWLQNNLKKMAGVLSNIALEKAQFIKKNKLYPKEKYANIEAEWQQMRKKHAIQLQDYEFNLRILQEARVVQNFMSIASSEEKARYKKFVDCENSPMF